MLVSHFLFPSSSSIQVFIIYIFFGSCTISHQVMPPLPDFNSPKLLGALEIGAFVSIFMFGIVTMQGYIYYQNCKALGDSSRFIFFVTLILLLELGHTIAAAHTVWWATITIADMAIKPGNGYVIVACTLYSAVMTFLVKIYYIKRIRILSSKLWLAIVGWLLSGIDFCAALMVSYVALRDVPHEPDNFELQREWGWLIISCFSLGALVDVFITAALVYHLFTPLPAFPVKGYWRIASIYRALCLYLSGSSAKLLKELLIWTIETGLITSLASVACVVCFRTMEYNYIWFAVYLPLAKLYSNCLLASLNARPARRQRRHQDYGSPNRSQTSLGGTKSPVSWASGVSKSMRRSTIGSVSIARVNALSPAISGLRRLTVGSPLNANTRKEFSNTTQRVNTIYPRQKINSLLDMNGKMQPRNCYMFASTKQTRT
ncbi:hypothetical protein F5050DRAFT_1295252 [Lentinula boryana]|uniref:DUF6534 domain-containing protein n=1 Tax=Lentinula boryana TaxID=40481 RepID=A0ABQ8QI31_9AGAR|nr:hypothetical protein F5050DRAFT_1295252 [Lentinula boryana]